MGGQLTHTAVLLSWFPMKMPHTLFLFQAGIPFPFSKQKSIHEDKTSTDGSCTGGYWRFRWFSKDNVTLCSDSPALPRPSTQQNTEHHLAFNLSSIALPSLPMQNTQNFSPSPLKVTTSGRNLQKWVPMTQS